MDDSPFDTFLRVHSLGLYMSDLLDDIDNEQQGGQVDFDKVIDLIHQPNLARVSATSREKFDLAIAAHKEWLQQRSESVSENKARLKKAEVMESLSADKSMIFVCYSHVDVKCLDRIQVHLRPIEKRYPIVIWSDKEVKTGDIWAQEIELALNSCEAAILLISPDFLASDFINKIELPKILGKAEELGTRIFPIVVGHCNLEANEELSKFRSVNDPTKPLSGMSESEQENCYSELAKQVLEAIKISNKDAS